jgi:2-haloacid dehalogenase
VLRALSELPAAPDAAEAAALAGDCAVLTNGGLASTRALVERAGLPIETILSCEEVRAYKPSAAPYLHARERLGECVLVATHAWDVAGARAAGLRAIWVDRSERTWPLAGVEPGERAASLVEAVRGL